MSKVKLDLKSKDFAQLFTFATEHGVAVTGNPNFLTLDPPAAAYNSVVNSYRDNLTQIAVAETALEVLRSQRGVLRISVETVLNTRGAYVQKTADGSEPKILSAAFQVQEDGSPTTSMDKPYEVTATMGVSEGQVDVSCHAVPRAKTYIIEHREHSDTVAPGPWVQGKIGTRSYSTVVGLAPGKKYGFHVRALGPNELESPWSDEVVCMAP